MGIPGYNANLQLTVTMSAVTVALVAAKQARSTLLEPNLMLNAAE